jgi:hypothetical protein
MAHVTKRFGLLVLLTLVVAGCATTAALRSGERAEFAQDYDLAVAGIHQGTSKGSPESFRSPGLERVKVRARSRTSNAVGA